MGISALAKEYGQPYAAYPGAILLPMRLTQGDIAALIKMSREAVNRAFRCLRTQHVIECIPSFRIVILAPDLLVALAHPVKPCQ